MVVESLPSNQFIVKVRKGRMDRPVYMKRRAVMIFNRDQKDITFSFDNCCTILKAKFISRVPWSPPRGYTLRFVSDTRNDEEMVLEFESHEKLMEAFSILKNKYLERSQFVFSSELHSGRGLHTTGVDGISKRPADYRCLPSITVESRQSVRDHLFERLSFLPPSEKRSKQPSEVTTEQVKLSSSMEVCAKLSQATEGHEKMLLLESEGPEKIKKNRRDTILVEYRKIEHSPVQLKPAMRSLEDIYKIKKPTSQKKIFGFANLGNTCYMNAMLQGLFAMDIFARDLFKFCKKVQTCKVDLDEIMPMSLALSSLASIRDGTSFLQKRKLLAAVKDVSRFEGNAQQDANEFLVHVLNQVHDECDKLLREHCGIVDVAERRMQNPVLANFAFTTQSTIICNMCHNVSQTDENSIFLPVTISVLDQASERFPKKFSRFPSVQTLLDEFLKTENIERRCEVCQGKSGQRTQKFVQLPRCLIILIKRYIYDESKSVKRADRIDIPLYLTLNGYCIESPAPFLSIPPSTKKIDFVNASPIKTKLLSSKTPSPARRRLNLSDEQMSNGTHQQYSVAEKKHSEIAVWTDAIPPFVVPGDNSKLEDGDQITEAFVTPWNSAEDSKSSRNLTCEELSHMSEEQQLQWVCEQSLLQTGNKSSDSSMSLGLFEARAEEENGKTEVPRESDDIYSIREENSEEKPNSDVELSEQRNEQTGRNTEGIQSTSRMEYENGSAEHSESNSGAELRNTDFREIPVKKTVAVPSTALEGERIKQDDCKTEPEVIQKSHMKSLVQSPITIKLQENQRQEDCTVEKFVPKNFDELFLSQKRPETPAPQKAMKDERESTRPSTPVPPNSPTHMTKQYQEEMSREDTPSNSDAKEILEESGVQLVPYKPISVEKRRAICSQIGLLFNYDCIEKTTVRIMGPNDRPSRVAGIAGDGNCLFRALAFCFAGSDNEHSRVRESIVEFEAEHWYEFAVLKGWSSEVWNNHMNRLLTDSTWGTEIELFAVAAMLNVDVWTYYNQRWICYRPRFVVINGFPIRISVDDYRVGDNDGIYLLNEFNHFTPVLEPSNTLLMEGADERMCDLILNANEGFMKPSYRLVSVISHIGQTSESGHYICDIWCKKNKGWLHCDDEKVSPMSETKIRSRNNVGYIYFYLNRELFESENT